MIETKKGRITRIGPAGPFGRWVQIVHLGLPNCFFVPAPFEVRGGEWLVAAVRNGCLVVMLFINGKRVRRW